MGLKFRVLTSVFSLIVYNMIIYVCALYVFIYIYIKLTQIRPK